MIYQAYQALADSTDPWKVTARVMASWLHPSWFKLVHMPPPWSRWHAALDTFSRTRLTHHRPDFAIPFIVVNNEKITVEEQIVHQTAFCTLLRFHKAGIENQPKILLVAPMSGHFATLLRGTVRTLLRDHDVYITDWHNARDVPLSAGKFDMDSYITHLIEHINVMGSNSHIVAVCQPTVAALAAVAVMAQQGHSTQPTTMTLMAGPIDTRINPTTVNELAKSKPIEWFEKNLIGTVPLRFKGAMRRVYPGFVQLSAFLSMNMERHVQSFKDMQNHLNDGEFDKAAAIKSFYEEYFAMSDLPAEFYLETVRTVFQEHDLPKGQLTYQGQQIDPAAIKRTALLTVEGEKDDICAIGQTLAAHDLCSSLRPYMKQHHIQTGAGHYGVFNGRRWEHEIYPLLRNFIHAHHASHHEKAVHQLSNASSKALAAPNKAGQAA